MIFKSNFPQAPDVDIVLSGASVDYTSIDSIEIDLSENAHDMAVIEFVGLPTSAITDYVGVPVYITISASPVQQTAFYGYVSYVEPMMYTRRGLVNKSPAQRAKVVCFGASQAMMDQKSKVWENTTVPKMVDEIASRYGFSYSVPSDRFVWDRLLQSHESDWSFLVRSCNSIGYYVTCNGTHIHVYDPYKTISRRLPYVELQTVSSTLGNMNYAPGRILEFHGTFGDKTPDGVSDATKMIGTDPTGVTITSEEVVNGQQSTGFGEMVKPRFTNTLTTEVDSIQMLNKFVGAINRSRYPYNATVSITGLPDPVPGSVAKIDRYDSYFDGYWLVKSVKHRISRSNYVTDLTIATDSTNKAAPAVAPIAAFTTPPTPTLNNNSWSSSAPLEEVYV